VAVAVVAAAVGACAPFARPPRPAAPLPPLPTPAAAPGTLYRIDAGRSEVRILVYRGGLLESHGHNHVLISRDLTGEIHLPSDRRGGSFELSVPVVTLAIDEPVARREEGAGFESEPSAADIEGTRGNLLGNRILNAAVFPRLTVSGVGTDGPGPEAVDARIDVAGRIAAIAIPLRVEASADELSVSGQFVISQTALGLTPFSVALGALQVRDELRVRFRIVAQRAP
jgi:hypothetical protein